MLMLVVYLAGVAIGLTVMRDPWPSRVGTALVWPLGPMAFIIVVALFLVTAAALWPIPVLGMLLVLTGVAWLLL
jgi:hypothetical protein